MGCAKHPKCVDRPRPPLGPGAQADAIGRVGRILCLVTSSRERRRARRLKAPEGFEVVIYDSMEGRKGSLVDISESGLAASTSVRLKPGQVAVEVRSPKGTRVTVLADVRRVDGNHEQPGSYQIGFELQRLTAVQRIAYDALMSAVKKAGAQAFDIRFLG